MANKLIRPVTKEYIPGVAGIAPQPARCYTQTLSGLSSTSGSVGSSQTTFIPVNETENGSRINGFAAPVYREVTPYIDSAGNLVTRELVGYTAMRFSPSEAYSSGSTGGSAGFSSFYTRSEEQVCTPAIAGRESIPAQINVQNAGPDWRASARSIETRTGDVTAAFDVPNKPTLIIGFATRDTGSVQSDIKMGVAFVQAGVSTQVFPIINGVQQPTIGNYTSGDRVYLSRVGDQFFIQSGSTLLYSDSSTTSDPVFLDAMLYTSNDFVDNPEFADPVSQPVNASVGFNSSLSTATGVDAEVGYDILAGTLVDGQALLQVRATLGFDVTVLAAVDEELAVDASLGYTADARTGVVYFNGQPPLSGGVENTDLNAGTVLIGPLKTLASDKLYAEGDVELSSIQVEADGGLLDAGVSGSDVVLTPMLTYGSMFTGGLLDATLSLSPLAMLAADRDYGQGSLTLPTLLTYGDDGFGIPGFYGHNENFEIYAEIFPDPTLFASIYGDLELEPSLSLGTLVSGSVLEALILDPTTTVADFIAALIDSGITLSSATQLPDPRVAQYAFNSLTGAATRYSDFGFDQFARTDNGTAYAVKADGLYRLRRGDDAGERRSAMVDFGEMAFGQQQLKYIESMFFGMSTDGTVYARLKADGSEEKVYRVVQRDTTLRVRTAKGVYAREWSLKLEVVDATKVDLDNIDFLVGASARRWKR